MADKGIDTNAARKLLWANGKCGSISLHGNLCNLTANHRPRNHELQQVGGVNDGFVIEEWEW